MGAPEMSDEEEKLNGNGTGETRDSESLAKLSQELNNWRRRRTSSRPSRADGPAANYSEPARTIKVRGHETLVVRKSKIVAPKPPSNPAPSA
ncbi:MAG TPA: hypothetical protein VJX23_16620 [Candidatus Binataceae bacterium]|nr:hypothetical protein [Candidatus Binataceae bacterium]